MFATAQPAFSSWSLSRSHFRLGGRNRERYSFLKQPGGRQTMSEHISISPQEAADRLAIRELVEAYAHCADRRDAHGQMSLFTVDTHFVVYMNAKDPTPSQELHSREDLARVFA